VPFWAYQNPLPTQLLKLKKQQFAILYYGAAVDHKRNLIVSSASLKPQHEEKRRISATSVFVPFSARKGGGDKEGSLTRPALRDSGLHYFARRLAGWFL